MYKSLIIWKHNYATEPKECLFTINRANYAKSIELLRERFAQPHTIINAHMEALLNLPPPIDN